MKYQLTDDANVVLCLETLGFIPRGSPAWDEYETWVESGGVPLPIHGARTLEQIKQDLITAATTARWEHETGGIVIEGVRVGTTLDDQNRLSGVLASITLGGLERVDFKAQSGWVELTAAQLQGIARAISAHVQACFSAERAHHEAIALIESHELAELYDLAGGWPG